ncbi:DUF1614 domain-containing protein [Salinibacter sp.]|uniref:DUF1614 domain-containing protein n=1 Tax=Salinibacter sp. TaxID=2065818 RepID=UPI0021E911C6|nr:DUF1614 domain-containing protein [Salinibacter sp.]
MRTAPTGCLSLLMFGLVLALPFLLANAVLTALTKLGLGPLSALGVALGIFVGGAVNVPVARIEQAERVEYQPTRLLGLHRLLGRPVRHRAYTVIAVNVGGCLVPTALAGYQIGRIALQPLIPARAAALSGLVLAPAWAPPVAFAAGVLGPLIGADLLHLGDIADIGTGMASIGGAGTFDGVVLSGLVATLLVPGAL